MEKERNMHNEYSFTPNCSEYKPQEFKNYPKELTKSEFMKRGLADYYLRMERARAEPSPNKRVKLENILR